MTNEKEILKDIIQTIIDTDINYSDPFWFTDTKWELSFVDKRQSTLATSYSYFCLIDYVNNLVIHQKKLYISKSDFEKQIIKNRDKKINQVINEHIKN